MTTETTAFVALQDEAGRYYLLPRAAVAEARVADEAVARLETLLDGRNAEDVEGYGVIAPHAPNPARFALGAGRFSNRGIIVVGGYDGLRLAGISFAGR